MSAILAHGLEGRRLPLTYTSTWNKGQTKAARRCSRPVVRRPLAVTLAGGCLYDNPFPVASKFSRPNRPEAAGGTSVPTHHVTPSVGQVQLEIVPPLLAFDLPWYTHKAPKVIAFTWLSFIGAYLVILEPRSLLSFKELIDSTTVLAIEVLSCIV